MEALKRPCAFVIRIDMHVQNLISMLTFFSDRKINLESMHLQTIAGGEALVVLYCRIERDRIKHVQHSLEKVNGVLSLELLEGKG
jgi:hypothetical protein